MVHLDPPAPRCSRPWCQGTSMWKAISHPSPPWPNVPMDRRNSRGEAGGGGNRENRGSLLLSYFMSGSATNKLTSAGGGIQIVALNQTCIWTVSSFKESLAACAGWSMGTGAQVPRSEFWLHNFVCVWPWGRERPTVHARFLSVKQWWVIVDGKSLSACSAESSPSH